MLLISCGGNSADPTDQPDPPTLPPIQTEPVDMREAFEDLVQIFSDPVVYTELQNIPTTGTVNYDGYFVAELSNKGDGLPDELVANLSLTVRFEANGVDVSGEASNFFDGDNNQLAGALSVSAGELDRTGNPNDDATFTAGLSGDLSANSVGSFSVATRLEGDFLGQQNDALGGAVFGRVTQGGQAQDIDGSFLTAR